MNKERRNQISKIITSLETLRYEIENLREDEQEAFDNLPEGIQCSDRGEAMEAAASELDDAYNSIDEAISQLETAKGG